jgi:endoglucanase
MRIASTLFVLLLAFCAKGQIDTAAWIRINLLGYKPDSHKVAVLCSKIDNDVNNFVLINAANGEIAYSSKAVSDFGRYGPFSNTSRLNFSEFSRQGKYFIKAGSAISPTFEIRTQVYDGIADFCLRYMRQQRSGYNPFLKDSCHTQDGYTVYGPMKDGTHIDVSGGWHDATDYLQYAMTSANATYHLLAAYRDFPTVFPDQVLANGLPGANKIPDVLDEATWGLQWLLKMHPHEDQMFNQLADDRDHVGFRLPNHDKANYGKGKERPVYFINGEIQGLNKYKNNTTGTSSTAAKFSSTFSLGYQVLSSKSFKSEFTTVMRQRAESAYKFALRKPGYTQTASFLAPYIYQEENWVDDMELASVHRYQITGDKSFLERSFGYAKMEKQTPWLGTDTASHYQWYPFINIGHYELAIAAEGKTKKKVIEFYKEGIEKVWKKAKTNAFLRGVPYIWCSNNLQTSFAIQCYWYRRITGDNSYLELEQSTFDFLFGCNPWGTSMVTGLPMNGDYPDDPHSSFNLLYGFQTWGALVDGPVYGSIYKQQRGVTIVRGDEYANFQSDDVVYHDDYGDYVTNEPTMDGTASLIYLLAAQEAQTVLNKKNK